MMLNLSVLDEQVAFPEPGKLQLYGLNLRNAGRYQCHVTNSVGISEGFECILRVEEGEQGNYRKILNANTLPKSLMAPRYSQEELLKGVRTVQTCTR